MKDLKDFFKECPCEKQLDFAIFFCKKNNIDAYTGLALFMPRFEAVEWFTAFSEH